MATGPSQDYTFVDFQFHDGGDAESSYVSGKMWTTNKNLDSEFDVTVFLSNSSDFGHTLTVTANKHITDGSYDGYYDVTVPFNDETYYFFAEEGDYMDVYFDNLIDYIIGDNVHIYLSPTGEVTSWDYIQKQNESGSSVVVPTVEITSLGNAVSSGMNTKIGFKMTDLGGGTFQSYLVEYSKNSDFSDSVVNESSYPVLSVGTTMGYEFNLPEGDLYYIRVGFKNEAGTGYSQVMTRRVGAVPPQSQLRDITTVGTDVQCRCYVDDLGSGEVINFGIQISSDASFTDIVDTVYYEGNDLTNRAANGWPIYITCSPQYNQTFYYRAFCTTTDGVGYSSVKNYEIDADEDDITLNNLMIEPTPSFLKATVNIEITKNNNSELLLTWQFYDKTSETSLKTIEQLITDYEMISFSTNLDLSTLENDVYGHQIEVIGFISNPRTAQKVEFPTEGNSFNVPAFEFFDFKGPVESYYENFNVLNSVYIKSLSLSLRKLLTSTDSKYINGAVYSFEITQGNDPSTDEAIIQVVHYKEATRPVSADSITLTYQTDKREGVLDVYNDNIIPEGKTTKYNYFLEWGKTYNLGYRIIFRYLGITRIFSKKFTDNFYILNNVSFTNNYYASDNHGPREYKVENGYLKFRYSSFSFYGISNPNNEEVSYLYMGDYFNGYEVGSSSSIYQYVTNHFDVTSYDHTITSKQTFPVIDSESEFVIAFNAYVHGKHYLKMGGNKYPESKLSSLLSTNIGEGTTTHYSCNINSASFTNGISIDNITCRIGDNSLQIGELPLLLEVAKDRTFSNVTHTQRKNLTSLGTIDNFFDIIETDESDVGTNYLRLKLETENSELYYKMKNVTSNVMQIEVPLVSKVNSFIASLNLENKIIVNVDGTNDVYVDLYRKSDDEIPYTSYQVTSGEDFEIPLHEPGTTWFIKARSTDGTNTKVLTETDEDGNEYEVEYQITIPYTYTLNYEEIANPTLTADKLQLDNTANLTFNFEEIETNVDHVKYDIEMFTTNYPIDPLRFENVEQGLFNHTFESRLDDEVLSYELNVTLYNSFNDVLKKYVIKSNEVTLDAVDLNSPGFHYAVGTTYHSLTVVNNVLDNTGYKLYKLHYKVCKINTTEVITEQIFGDDEPSLNSEPLIAPTEVLFDNLPSGTYYTVRIDVYCVNPLDMSKRITIKENRQTSTNTFKTPAPYSITMGVTNTVSSKPTKYSDFELTWMEPSLPTVPPKYYTVEYKKNDETEYTAIQTTERYYTLSSKTLGLADNDEVYIRIGAHYVNPYTNEEFDSYKEFNKQTVAETSYEYYRCSYPEIEVHQRKMFKMLAGEPTERMIRDIYMNK